MNIKALTIDTGGTIFDWHTSLVDALSRAGARNSLSADFHAVANIWRRLSLKYVAGRELMPESMEEVHRKTLELTLKESGLQQFSDADRIEIMQAWYKLKAWPGFPAAINRIRSEYQVASLTLLPAPLVIRNSRENGISWDAIFSCQMIGYYKPHPNTYITAAAWLDLEPSDILMVACHNIDLNAAAKAGFRTAFIHRRNEWGLNSDVSVGPNMKYDFVEEDFEGLAQQLAT